MRSAAVLCGLWVAAGQATTFQAADVESLAAKADAVVVARVNATRVKVADARSLVSIAECEVTQALKGTPGAAVRVVSQGGELGDVAQHVAGSPRLSTGDEVVLFLSRMPGGAFTVTGWAQGVLVVDRASGTPVLRPQPHDARVVAPVGKQVRPAPADLKALRSRVRAVVEAGR